MKLYLQYLLWFLATIYFPEKEILIERIVIFNLFCLFRMKLIFFTFVLLK